MPSAESDLETQELLRFNGQLLDQALALVRAHEATGRPGYDELVGPHLRHVIEHFEALLCPRTIGVVDYDRRARDRALEQDTAIARQRLSALQSRLLAPSGVSLGAPLRVRLKGGLAGEFDFEFDSSFGRELAFVAGHAVHHFALLKAHCDQHGIATAAAFGQAPATVAHGRGLFSSTTKPAKEAPCPAPVAAA